MTRDPSFQADERGLSLALDLLLRTPPGRGSGDLPDGMPETGLGDAVTIERLAGHVIGTAAHLNGPEAFAHMDPPTPWVTWALSLWNARLNQNLLHPATAPFARRAEALVVDWLAPAFAMGGGHMTPGSTIANLTALWAARETAGVNRVLASTAAHLSIAKSAHLLGMAYQEVPVDDEQRLVAAALPKGLGDVCLVLTAGTTSAGVVDPLDLAGRAAWTHVDAAWAGPLRLSDRYGDRLDGVTAADSVAVSAHKWLFQPKESALVFFQDVDRANEAISFGGNYLATPNVGVLGSHGAAAVPLLGTLLAWGRQGMAERIDRCMDMAEDLSHFADEHPELELFAKPETGVVLFRPLSGDVPAFLKRLPPGLASITRVGGEPWLRCVAANPNADMRAIVRAIEAALAM